MKVVVYNLGCKVNQYESDAIMTRLAELGYEVADSLQYADAYVLNTCAVTGEAEKKSRQAVARCLHFNSNARVIVCGCASEHDEKQFSEKSQVTYISGVAGKAKIPELLSKNGVFVEQISGKYEDDLHTNVIRTRAYVKIQDGCNNFCSYCLIPYLRGRSRSRALASVVAECERLAEKTNEIVLTGIDMSSYGKDIGSSLAALIASLKHIKVRIRLGSLETNVVTREFLQATKLLQNFCPHFHLSLQSGDDHTLAAMNRKYTTDFYAEKVQLIREFYANAAITTDVICGFPTETDAQFENTLNFARRMQFADMHIFAYSKREGTVAAKYKSLPGDVVKNRVRLLEAVADELKQQYCSRFVGKEVSVLIEDDGGYTKEYVKVLCSGREGDVKAVIPTRYDAAQKALVCD